MKGYGQFCPIAKAAEIFCERWTALVIRNLGAGAERFNDIHRGVPHMSATLLTRRLRQLEAEGLVQRRRSGTGKIWTYHLTEAGAEFLPLVPLMEPSGQATLALASESLDAHAFTRVFECAREAGDWMPVVLLLLHLRPKVHERIKPLVSQLSAENARLILAQADALGVLPQIDSVWKSLGNAS